MVVLTNDSVLLTNDSSLNNYGNNRTVGWGFASAVARRARETNINNDIAYSIDNTINIIKNTYEQEIRTLRQQLMNEIVFLRNEINRINNTPPPPPPLPEYSKEDICAEILDSVEEIKTSMEDQAYRIIMDKLQEIHMR
jgi:hypothetical protein